MVIEDTGKTWPVQDAKCAVLVASRDIYREVYNIHTSVLLNVSPFVLKMLTEYVKDSERDEFASVRDVLEENRAFARNLLEDSLLQWQAPMTGVSVAWFRIRYPRITSPVLQSRLRANGTYVLPGTYFYWKHRATGLRYVRVALARDPSHFKASLRNLRTTLDAIASEWSD
jgi:aspartate/methionine/tyrosine aminotransferase